jgi:hypothetical protein
MAVTAPRADPVPAPAGRPLDRRWKTPAATRCCRSAGRAQPGRPLTELWPLSCVTSSASPASAARYDRLATLPRRAGPGVLMPGSVRRKARRYRSGVTPRAWMK